MKNQEPTPCFLKRRLMLACNFVKTCIIFQVESQSLSCLRVLVHPETFHGDPDRREGGEEREVHNVSGGGEGQEEEPEPQDDEHYFVVNVDGEDAEGVDDLNAGAGTAHANVAVDETVGGGKSR